MPPVIVKYRPKVIPRIAGSIDFATYKKDALVGIQSISISTDTNNLIVDDLLSTVLFTVTIPSNLTGIAAPSPIFTRVIYVRSTGPEDLIFKHNSSLSTTVNRFFCPGGIDLTISINEGAVLLYDTINTRWTVLSFAKGGVGGSGIKKESHITLASSGVEVTF